MQSAKKRDLILDAMQELMLTDNVQSISVSEIAQKAGIGKGSIYYYFSSKNDILEAVIERSYSRVLDGGKELAAAGGMDAFQKMEIIYRACLDSSLVLHHQEEVIGTFNELQQGALIYQNYARMIITKLEPILSDIIRQGILEGNIRCEYPDETARIVLIVLTTILANQLAPVSREEISRVMKAFIQIQESGLGIPHGILSFLNAEGFWKA